MTTHIIYHRGCPDGFTAAWLIHQLHPDATLTDAMYGEEPPAIEYGDRVFIVDFCYPPDGLHAITEMAGQLVILDHHETSRQWMLDTFGVFGVVTDIDRAYPLWFDGSLDQDLYVSDFNLSGAGLAAIYSLGTLDSAPAYVKHVQDRDLWRWQLEGTAEVFAAVTARPYTIEAYNELAELSDQELVEQGQGIAMYRQRLIEQTVDTAHQTTVLGHPDIWVAAAPYAIGSDVAGELAKRDPDRFACYFVQYGDRVRFGLRSTEQGANVAEVAALAGGGGHAHASGFEVASWDEVAA